MASSVKIAPANSLLLVSDAVGARAPEITRDGSFWSSSTCLAIGCLAFMDGETEVTLGDAKELSLGGAPIFDGLLETPTRNVAVWTVELEPVLGAVVPNQKTRVRIWTNHLIEPDKVAIGLG